MLTRMSGLLDAYVLAMRRRSLAGDRHARRGEVRRWLAACPGWATAAGEDVERVLDGRPSAPRARYTALSHLHRFYVWAIRHGHTTADPTEQIDRPRLPRRLPRPARLADVELSWRGRRRGWRRSCCLMVDAGLRCCEVARLEWSDVDLAGGVLIVRGKGDRERMFGLTPRLAADLAAYDDTAGPVFGRTVTPARMSQVVNRELRRAAA